MTQIDLTEAQIADAELAWRELARAHLLDYTEYTFHGYRAAAVHRLLCHYLEQVELYVRTQGAQGIGRLMVFMPPRHGKSEQVSVRFPAWFLGRNPDCRVILSSCTGDLAVGFSRQVRDQVISTEFRALFGANSGATLPVEISESSQAAQSWDMASHRGGMVAAGIGGRIIGQGFHLGIIDDPFKSRNEVESKKLRDDVERWYRSAFYSRQQKGGAIVLMHQRWHEDDLAGRLLRQMVEEPDADRWTVLCLPAVAEEWAQYIDPLDALDALKSGYWKGVDPLGRAPGEALWPEEYGKAFLAQIHANTFGYEWDAMYQQRPRRVEGALVKANDIPIIGENELPDELTRARYWDLAVSGRARADYISGGLCARDRRERFYICDIARFKGPWSDARAPMMQQMLRDDPAIIQGIEVSGQQGGYYQELKVDPALKMRQIVPVSPRDVGSKEVRAGIWASRIEDGLVYLVRGPWNDEFVREALAFPRGQHDDLVDCVSGAWQMLSNGGGWTNWARQQVDGTAAPQAENAGNWAGKRGEWAIAVRIAAARGDLAPDPADFGINPVEAGNILAQVAAEYVEARDYLRASICLNERKRLGV